MGSYAVLALKDIWNLSEPRARAKTLIVTRIDYITPGGLNWMQCFESLLWSAKLMQMLLCQTLRASGLNLNMIFSGGPAITGLGPQDPRPYLAGMTGVSCDVYTSSDLALMFELVA